MITWTLSSQNAALLFFSLFPNCCCTAIQHAELLSCNHFANLGSGGARRAVPRFTGRRQISAWELSSFLSAYDHCHHHRHACSSSSLSSLSLMANALLSLPRTGYSHLPRKNVKLPAAHMRQFATFAFSQFRPTALILAKRTEASVASQATDFEGWKLLEHFTAACGPLENVSCITYCTVWITFYDIS